MFIRKEAGHSGGRRGGERCSARRSSARRGHPFGGRDEGDFTKGGYSGHGRGGGRRRMFDSGELRLVLLKLISDQARHGYDLIRAIDETARKIERL